MGTKKIHKLHRHGIVKSMIHRKRFSRFLKVLGPGIVTGAADDDPSGIASYSQAGAAYGFGLLWIFPIMYPMLLAVQESCARIGAVTGRGLASIIKDNYSRKLLFAAVSLVVVANVVNIGADLGAMAATAQLLVPLPFELLATGFAILVLLLEVFVNYKTYAKILKWLAIALLAYPVTAFLVGQDWPVIFQATMGIGATLPADPTVIYMIVGLLGTTISPYLFFWDTSEIVEGEIATHRLKNADSLPKVTKHFIRNVRIDNFTGMSLATVTAWFIVITCASVLFSHGVNNIDSAADAARALEPLVQNFPNAGLIAKLIFSFGIIGIGLLAVPVLAGSSSYAISEAFGWKEGLYRKFKRAHGFYGVIIVATLVGLAMNFLGINPIDALIFSAVLNGVAAVPLLWMLLRIGRNREILGDYVNGRLSNFFVRFTLIVMTVAALALAWSVMKP